MTETVQFRLLGATLFLIALSCVAAAQGPTSSILDLLRTPYSSDVPLLTTGRSVWAGHPLGWAFDDQLHFYRHTPVFGPCFELRIASPDGLIQPRESHSSATEVRLLDKSSRVHAFGKKYITSDDVLVTEMDFENTTDQAIDLLLESTCHFPARLGAGQVLAPIVLHGIRRSYALHAPGFQPTPTYGLTPPWVWTEAESALEIEGGTIEYRRAASAGRVLGGNFGAKRSHYATYKMKIPTKDKWSVLFRYTRLGGEKENEFPFSYPIWQVTFEALERQTGGLICPPSGGPGLDNSEYLWGRIVFPEVEPADYTLRLYTNSDNAPTAFDGFYLVKDSDYSRQHFNVPVPSQTFLERTLSIPPKGRERLVMALAVGRDMADAEAKLKKRCEGENPKALHDAEVAEWFSKNCPRFRCSDENVNRLYVARCQLLRRHVLELGEGALQAPVLVESRDPSGSAFGVTAFGAAHRIREARWLRDGSLAASTLSTHLLNRNEDGTIAGQVVVKGGRDQRTAEWIVATLLEVVGISGDLKLLETLLEPSAAAIQSHYARFDPDGDGLIVAPPHRVIGLEAAPSFLAFANSEAPAKGHDVERVDLSAYAAGGARAVARGYRILGAEKKSQLFDALADKTIASLTASCFDEKAGWLHSLHAELGSRVSVAEATDLAPFYFSVLDTQRSWSTVFDTLLDPAQFWTNFPIPSCSLKTPLFHHEALPEARGRSHRRSDGRASPHTTSFVISAMAAALRASEGGKLRPDHVLALFQTLTDLHLRSATPRSGEAYRSDTGEWLGLERERCDSTWIDLLFGDLIGIRPRTEEVFDLHPMGIPKTWTSFSIEGLRYHGCDVDLHFDRAQNRFTVTINGQLRHEGPELTRVQIPLHK